MLSNVCDPPPKRNARPSIAPEHELIRFDCNEYRGGAINALIKSVEGEFRRYKALAEAALDQVPEEMLSSPGPSNGNSLATICWHMSGNLQSRFTDFLTSDGEKPWRQREEEFASRTPSRAELMAKWTIGWDVLFGALAALTDEDLSRIVKIRAQELTVSEALHRSLAHAAYHVGQIVYVAHAMRGDEWQYLSIPPGGTAAYNADPKQEKALSREPSQVANKNPTTREIR